MDLVRFEIDDVGCTRFSVDAMQYQSVDAASQKPLAVGDEEFVPWQIGAVM